LSSPDRVARAVFALLVIACFAAFFVTQRLKHTPTAVQNFELTTSFTPARTSQYNQEGISFKLAEADEATVTIIDSNGDVVATLGRDMPVPRYKQFSLRWTGHEGTARRDGHLKTPSGRTILVPEIGGRIAPAGEYRVEVKLRRQNRTVLSPRSFTLVSP